MAALGREGEMSDADLLALEERLLDSGAPSVETTNRLEYIATCARGVKCCGGIGGTEHATEIRGRAERRAGEQLVKMK
jgi:hypothetical protein